MNMNERNDEKKKNSRRKRVYLVGLGLLQIGHTLYELPTRRKIMTDMKGITRNTPYLYLDDLLKEAGGWDYEKFWEIFWREHKAEILNMDYPW